jgi:hypothetical protein
MGKLGTGQVALCEELLRNIPDVVSARVVFSPDDATSSVQVLAGAERNASEVAADVIAVMKKYFSIEVKPEMISVTHLQEPAQSGSTMSVERRPRFAGLNISSKGNQVEIRVEIANEGALVSGVAVGPSSTRNRQRLLAQATLNAMSNWTQSGYTFILEDLMVISLAGKRVAIVGVSLLSPMGEEFLTGSAVVDEEEPYAIIRGTLDAINRRLTVLSG